LENLLKKIYLMENVLGKYIENKFGCQRMLLGNIWKISLNVAEDC